MIKRFDRTNEGKGIHFASAMTLLGYTDGTDFHDGISYLELVAFIFQNGANAREHLIELFKRIVFSIAVNNTDDLLRNHGFILKNQDGYSLQPMIPIPVLTVQD